MTEKHHPASAQDAQIRVTRGVRRKDKYKLKAQVDDKTTQSRDFKEPTGFFRGARIK